MSPEPAEQVYARRCSTATSWQFGSILPWLDLFGIAIFATTGALAATRRAQTLVTAAFFALITGVGGGSVRDLLIGAPVFWVHDPIVAAVCLAMAALVWITPQAWWRGAALDWLDAVGLAAYAVFGVAKALAFGIPPVPAALMGVVTACLGGIIRDVLAGEPSILMRPELYVTAAALAASLHVAAGAARSAGHCRGSYRRRGGLQSARGSDPVEAGTAKLSRATLTEQGLAPPCARPPRAFMAASIPSAHCPPSTDNCRDNRTARNR